MKIVEVPTPLQGAIFELRKAREALDRAAACVEQAAKLASIGHSPQPFVVPPDPQKCRHNLVHAGREAPAFCEVCGSADHRCALDQPGALVRGSFGKRGSFTRSTADYDLRGESRPAPTPEEIRARSAPKVGTEREFMGFKFVEDDCA